MKVHAISMRKMKMKLRSMPELIMEFPRGGRVRSLRAYKLTRVDSSCIDLDQRGSAKRKARKGFVPIDYREITNCVLGKLGVDLVCGSKGFPASANTSPSADDITRRHRVATPVSQDSNQSHGRGRHRSVASPRWRHPRSPLLAEFAQSVRSLLG